MPPAVAARAAQGPVPFAVAALGLILCLVLGGGTRPGFLGDALLQMACVPLLAAALWQLGQSSPVAALRLAMLFCAGVCGVIILQLLPLPPAVWGALAGRAELLESYRIIEQPASWRPLSLSPRATWLTLASMIVPTTIFIATSLLPRRDRRRLSVVAIAIGTISVFIGLIQVAQGRTSPLRFFEFTNFTEAVGFFANRNHYSALLYCLALLTAVWAIEAVRQAERMPPSKRFSAASVLPVTISLVLFVVFIAAQAMARSRAGLGLTMLAMLGVVALMWTGRGKQSGRLVNRLFAASIVIALLFSVQFAIFRILERFDADALADSRIAFLRTTIAAAKTYAPLGAGAGTFVPVFAKFENIEDARKDTYANHAHNDAAELLLEAGAPGAVLLLLLAVWVIIRLLGIWHEHAPDEHAGGRDRGDRWQNVDGALARASTLIVLLLLLHSLVDYPLRTAGLAAVFAMALGLMVPPPASDLNAPPGSSQRGHKHRSQTPNDPQSDAGVRRAPPMSAPEAQTQVPPMQPAAQPPRPFVPSNFEWPEAWRKRSGRDDEEKG